MPQAGDELDLDDVPVTAHGRGPDARGRHVVQPVAQPRSTGRVRVPGGAVEAAQPVPLGQPTNRIIDDRRIAKCITPIPKPRKTKAKGKQAALLLGDSEGLSSAEQQYEETTSFIHGRAP